MGYSLHEVYSYFYFFVVINETFEILVKIFFLFQRYINLRRLFNAKATLREE